MICTLELETSPALKDGILLNWLVNSECLPENFIEGDLHQEHYNGELDESEDHNDAEWDGNLMWNVCSRNIHHFLWVKKEWGQGLGLAKEGGKHSEPHTKPEVRKLLQKYSDEELHLFRHGRQYDNADVNDFLQGYHKLQGRGLQQWITETMTTQGLMQELEYIMEMQDDKDGEEVLPDHGDEEELMPGKHYMHDGELVIETEELVNKLQNTEDSDMQRTLDENDGTMDIEKQDEKVDDKTDEVDKFIEVEFDDDNRGSDEDIWSSEIIFFVLQIAS